MKLCLFMHMYVSLHIYVFLCLDIPISIGSCDLPQSHIHLMFYYIIDRSFNHTCYQQIKYFNHNASKNHVMFTGPHATLAHPVEISHTKVIMFMNLYDHDHALYM